MPPPPRPPGPTPPEHPRHPDGRPRTAGRHDGAYAPDREVPLGGYAALTAGFAGGVGLFALGLRKSGRRLPERVPPWDVLVLGTAVYKASRLVSKSKVAGFVRAPFTRRTADLSAGEVMDEPQGNGPRRAVGDLLACPFCLSVWISGALVCSYAVAPRPTRLVASGLTAVALSDWLQYAWTFTQDRVEG
ncbi:DUF1360 domain-containing protein [Streptomyces sp. S07_1.15]|uniref:DUF1360 domain-containing protein n=1 Tax=Streptomyces sp. S07_1.15 TaxID=2873925 RepID=UPI001D15147E|nr:DUF1360 domain-containing protein [Streptomyces sp. S07_1.15]MCC3655655.1 DUF1360 domain-containing protein [Streptomyces sp. S07_1.15]